MQDMAHATVGAHLGRVLRQRWQFWREYLLNYGGFFTPLLQLETRFRGQNYLDLVWGGVLGLQRGVDPKSSEFRCFEFFLFVYLGHGFVDHNGCSKSTFGGGI